LPYAVGAQVTVLNTQGRRVFSWAAPAAVTALASSAEVLAVATANGHVYLFRYSEEQGWAQAHDFSGTTPATSIAWDNLTLFAQRGRKLDDLGLQAGDCNGARTLAPGERLVAAGAGRIVISKGGQYSLLPSCGARPVVSGTASAIALDFQRL